MPDYADAVQAIEDRLAANWTTTRIVKPNKTPDPPWPPKDIDGQLLPYVLIEVTNATSEIAGAGMPGNQLWIYDGLVEAHVFVPVNSGADLARQYAVAIGEMFRNKQFYDDTPGYCVRSLVPIVAGGDEGSDDGLWFRVTATIPFEYWHRG